MKAIWSIWLVFLALSTTGICAVEIPDLVGIWAGKGPGYNDETGYMVDADNTLNFSIMEQNGRLFNGELTYYLNGTEVVEGFAGTISPDNKTFYIAEFGSGYDVGTVISEDEIDLMYLLDGKAGAVFIETLRRVAE
jgi:hypothetical protein